MSRTACPATWDPYGKTGVLLLIAVSGAGKATVGAGGSSAAGGDIAGSVNRKTAPTKATPNSTIINSRFFWASILLAKILPDIFVSIVLYSIVIR